MRLGAIRKGIRRSCLRGNFDNNRTEYNLFSKSTTRNYGGHNILRHTPTREDSNLSLRLEHVRSEVLFSNSHNRTDH